MIVMLDSTMPHYQLTDEGGVLESDYYAYTRVRGYRAQNATVLLTKTGYLLINSGYEWDFGTGAINTPAVIAASLIHDGLTDLIREGELPKSTRKVVDKEYRRFLKLGGMGWWRRNYQYLAIRGYVRLIKPIFG